ncbi:16S rRNA (adenine(1518)-N(6)/adenine(1519)-N(6))-dimethyltransferase RsmA [Candidatus Shikimatogenerans silvanidophilus]|uniref:16S rRNA (adenine(1518)-N(6)/adenine(1519)-N(6))- dimethyltransferase RsmA n=1 Tax=Candidatus Shikimatogenerans silvanidophilus TaxID=2782547 RepID=UPI001BA60947|nr:16S rRNA (adenine(1518)-N(6)/adenine(1519)-N(6))-dimethyltransferase RsmA [Candidatus Shikimatogenerans silvanidophilus]
MIFNKKKFGQHFLINEKIAKKIIKYILINSNYKKSIIIEIGPGKGILSKYIFSNFKKIYFIEIDKDMIFFLKKKYPFLKSKIIHYNFLLWHPKYKNLKKIYLIGNFPYNISSQIIFWIFKNQKYVIECIGMFQKEVAERIISKNGKKYGIISILIQTFYKVKLLFNVSKHNFYPKPKVDSSVIKFTKKKKIIKFNKNLFLKIIKKSFNQRRKILKNSLFKILFKTLDLYIYKKYSFFNSFFYKRAEELSYKDFIEITKKIEKICNYNGQNIKW